MTRRSASTMASVAALAVMLTTSALAGAAPTAEERFDEGRALLKEGRPADAIPKFLESIARERTAVALLNLADAYERVGMTASAFRRFKEAAEVAADRDPKRADEATKRAAAIEPRLATLTLIPPANGTDVMAWIDGIAVPSTDLGKPVPHDPGEHEIAIAEKGKPARTVRVTLEEARGVSVTLESASSNPPQPVGVNPSPVADPHAHDDGESPLRTVGIVTAGVGAAALVAGGVFGALALSAKGELTDACPAFPQCPSDRRSDLGPVDERAHDFATASTISFIVGGALIAAGAVLFFTAPHARTGGRVRPRGVAFSW